MRRNLLLIDGERYMYVFENSGRAVHAGFFFGSLYRVLETNKRRQSREVESEIRYNEQKRKGDLQEKSSGEAKGRIYTR